MTLATMSSPNMAWGLLIALFLVVNIDAMRSCYIALVEDWCNINAQRQHARPRKRSRCLHDDRLFTPTHIHTATLARGQWKRRKLACRHGLPTHHSVDREVLWPWPHHTALNPLAISSDAVAWVASHALVSKCTAKMKELVHNALEELVVSCLSFLMCAVVVMMLRTYSTMVVGVSVDLGAFSIDI